jgi:dephospho-CoA kinase
VVAVGSDGLNQISNHFGADILNENKTLNRAKLRELIFKDHNQKTWLNNLLHPMIREQITYQLNQVTSPYVILVAPLLFENNLNKLCDRCLLIDVPVETQIQRTTSRDNVSTEQVKSIIASQMSREDKLNIADDVLDNSLSLDHADITINQLHQVYANLK